MTAYNELSSIAFIWPQRGSFSTSGKGTQGTSLIYQVPLLPSFEIWLHDHPLGLGVAAVWAPRNGLRDLASQIYSLISCKIPQGGWYICVFELPSHDRRYHHLHSTPSRWRTTNLIASSSYIRPTKCIGQLLDPNYNQSVFGPIKWGNNEVSQITF